MRPDLTTAEFRARLDAPGIRAVSCDVFDTALVRTFARPADLFTELGRLLAERSVATVTAERFGHLRVQAESEARRMRTDAEPTLSEIHQVLASRLGWNDAKRQAVEEMEIALERRAMRPVPRVQAWIDAARTAGRRIAFVSDMYLPANVVRAMLAEHCFLQPGDPVLVSCELRANKSGGGLFDRLTEILGLAPAEILHVGDDMRSDGIVPRSKGMTAVLVSETRLGYIEQRFLTYQRDTDGLSGRLGAAARLARLACAPNSSQPALNEIGAGLLGSWLGCFALWIFDRAARAGIRRLYFVSRDGQVMREIALAVQRRWPEAAGIECRYLHGSRIAWHHAAMHEIGSQQLAWLLNPQPCLNASILAARLGLPPEHVQALLAAGGTADLVAADFWTPEEIGRIAGVLRAQADAILQQPAISNRRKLAERYFAQEGLTPEGDWAIVELGWSGSMMASLHEALGRPAHLKAFYLNLSSISPGLPPAVNLESFVINPGDLSSSLGRGLRFAEMIEVLTSADHGTVLGYEESAGRIVPRLNTTSTLIWPTQDLAALRRGAVQFVAELPAEVLSRLAKQLAGEASARLLAHQLLWALADFMREPPPELARAFARCRFTEDPTDHAQRPFVRPLAFWPVFRKGWRTESELWAQGSLACTPPLTTALVHGGIAAAGAQLWRGALRRGRTMAGLGRGG